MKSLHRQRCVDISVELHCVAFLILRVINTVPDFCNRESNTVKISVFTDFLRNAYVENYIFLNEAKQLMSQTSFSAIIDNSSSFMSIDPQNVALEQLRQNNDLLK